MNKIFAIAKWEFFEKVKRKSFFVSMIITPLVLFGLVYLSSSLIGFDKNTPTTIGILDETNNYINEIKINLESYHTTDNQPSYIVLDLIKSPLPNKSLPSFAEQMIKQNDIAGLINIYYDPSDSLVIDYKTGTLSDPDEITQVEQSIKDAVLKIRLSEAGYSVDEINNLISNIHINHTDIDADIYSNEAEFIGTFLTGYLLILLLLIMILFAGGMFVRSTVEEKSNRIIEVLLSSCRVDQLLAGKILGLSMLGLFQIILWFVIGGFIFGNNYITLSLSNNFIMQIVYFVLGYILYTSIFVGFGSLVNSEHEAQQMTSILSIVLIIPILIASHVLLNPYSGISLFLSYFPLTTAPAMILRLNVIEISFTEQIVTLIIMAISIYFMIRLSTKIFRFGMLSFDKIPSIKELFDKIKTFNN